MFYFVVYCVHFSCMSCLQDYILTYNIQHVGDVNTVFLILKTQVLASS